MDQPIALALLVSLAATALAFLVLAYQMNSMREEVKDMAVTQDDVKGLVDAVAKLVDITKAALDAAAGDKAAKDVALADLAALRTDVAWLNDPELDQKIDDMIAAAASATPPVA